MPLDLIVRHFCPADGTQKGWSKFLLLDDFWNAMLDDMLTYMLNELFYFMLG
jgi:hypothetical protein